MTQVRQALSLACTSDGFIMLKGKDWLECYDGSSLKLLANTTTVNAS